MTTIGGRAAPITIAEALADARAAGLDRTDAMLLLGHLLQRPRGWLIAHDDAPLAAADAQAYAALCRRRADGEPVAYLLGQREFHGLALEVTPDVLVPRPDTETLVDWALELLPADTTAQVADLGTGSGAIALALAAARPGARVLATDLSAAAITVAQRNALRLDLALQVQWAQGAWWQPVPPDARFGLVVSNPPYIAGDDPHLPALRHEPRLALTPEGDGLGALREIVGGASAHLASGAWLLLEHGYDQAEAVRTLLSQAGFSNIDSRRDLGGQWRCSGGRWST